MDTNQYTVEIDPIFEKNVRESLEPLRKKIKILTSLTTGCFIAGACMWIVGGALSIGLLGLGFLLFPIAIIIQFKNSKLRYEYNQIYKQFVVEQTIKQTLEDYKFDPYGRFDANYLDAMRMFARTVRTCTYHGEDMLQGTYKGVKFQQADARISYTVGSGKNKRTVWVMKGRIAEFEYGKDIHSSVIVVPKKYSHANLGGLQKVQTENVAFNKKYHILSGDTHTAFYVLTPQLMEYIEKLNAKTLTYLRFTDGRVFIIQPNVGGAFEPNFSRNFDFRAEVQHVKNDMSSLLSIIDILDLDDTMEQHRNLHS